MEVPDAGSVTDIGLNIWVSITITGLVLASLLVLSWARGRKAARELEERMAEQGWSLLGKEWRWLFRGPYSFAAAKGVVFRINARDERGNSFAGYACVSAGWDDYATDRIEVLWDAPKQEPQGQEARGKG